MQCILKKVVGCTHDTHRNDRHARLLSQVGYPRFGNPQARGMGTPSFRCDQQRITGAEYSQHRIKHSPVVLTPVDRDTPPHPGEDTLPWPAPDVHCSHGFKLLGPKNTHKRGVE